MARLEPRRSQNRESTQLLPGLVEEVASTVPVDSSCREWLCFKSVRLELRADVPVDSSVATSVSGGDMVQSSDPISASVGIRPASSGAVGSLCLNECKAGYFEKLTLVWTSNASPGIPGRESVQGFAKTCLGNVCSRSDRNPLASSLQRAFNAAWPEYRGGCRT